MEPDLEINYKTEWPFKDEVGRSFSYWLRVDEYSSEAEVEAEIEYWMKEIRAYQIDGAHKSALMQAIRWMMSITNGD